MSISRHSLLRILVIITGDLTAVFTFERKESLPEVRPHGIPVYLGTEECGRSRHATLARIRQPDRTGGASLPVAREKRSAV
jgi:hypothetical protein